MIVARTHGGLGNQLFQLCYAQSLAAQTGDRVIRRHDIRYPVVFPASPLFVALDGDLPAPVDLLSWMRLPKLAHRATGGHEALRIGPVRLLDGYFQQAEQWQALPATCVSKGLAWLRTHLPPPSDRWGVLVHLRLGDFFADEAAERAHLDDRLGTLDAGSSVITNRDDLLATHADLLARRGVTHVPTTGATAEQVIALMMGYERIISNNSTIAIWASILSGAALAISDPRLLATTSLLRERMPEG